MNREDALRLVEQDSSSDYCEGIGEYGGWFSVYTDGDKLIVKVMEASLDSSHQGSCQEWSWKLIPEE